ncbi:MAG: MBOAT family protein [Caulobacteraceae bacterium]|nr:MAG: MBOAT family protein [Caulobacteraceae bacterium]
MLFVEPFFLFAFLPLMLAAFWVVSRGSSKNGALALLLVASAAFYANFGLSFLALLAGSIAINFAVGAYVTLAADSRARARRTALVLGLLWNFGALFYFKYLGYFAFLWTPGGGPPTAADLIIPVGISFYTFHQAVFLVDAYNRKPVVREYLGEMRTPSQMAIAAMRYGVFICFFPQLVIGPIVYLSEFAPSVLRRHFGKIRRLDLEIGVTLLVIGLFKKLVLADNLAPMSGALFQNVASGAAVDPLTAWVGILAYFLQLYFDFSGYTDMAIGLARLVGIRLPINFDSPLRASGIRDFYNRWHMTLTRVIVRFLFTPLSVWGTRTAFKHRLPKLSRKMLSVWLPLIVNFLVIALWHGALSTFLVFGLIHGAWVILETEVTASKAWRAWAGQRSPAFLRRAGQAVTVLPLMLTFSLFASPDLASFGRVLESAFLLPQEVVHGAVKKIDLLYIVFGLAIVWLAPNSTELLSRYRPAILTRENPSTTPAVFAFRWRPTPLWAGFFLILALVCITQLTRNTPFLYQGF